ncbi:DUF5723 family protein [Psychroserpens sp. Hel_I_66]|uniref:DUF5723 family protein n=1 Tax=Psychroserpens sp. Hel_I_66 TaxID=1250004 RepID=UPI000A8851D3|nr:DUF5723 family protein [Psychroserpens sp. Hel_I_66]
MRILNFMVFLFLINMASAQNYYGYLSDNYSGLHGVTLNPANLTGSKLRTEVNLASVNASVNNDYFYTDFGSLFEGSDIGDDQFNAAENNNFAISADIMGPSFMFNLSPKHSIGVITRARAFFNINEIKGELFDAFEDDFDSANDFSLNEDEFTSTLHGWAEIGVAYARTLINNEQHYLKGGVTLKYLRGLGNAYAKGTNLSVDYDADGFTPEVGTITTTGLIEYGSSQGISQNEDDSDFEFESDASGYGADIGFIYEWRPAPSDLDDESRSNYKLKLGVSITDIGSIDYEGAEANTYDITNSIDENTFESEEDFEDKLNNLYTRIATEDFTKVKLPTALHITADYNLDSQFFINLRSDLSLRKANELNTNKIDNAVVVTPRFERKWFSFYLP